MSGRVFTASAPADSRDWQSAGLTMLTVCTRKHYDDVRRHVKLMDRLNPGMQWRLIVVDNSDTGPSRFDMDDARVEIRAGLPLDLSRSEDVRFSYHHGAALNANLRDIRSRFLLVLDPDLFVVYPNWMRETIERMSQRKLCFFGTPWHPRWYTKYRYFPAVHFMLIDLQRVPLARLDFLPELVERPSWSRRNRSVAAELAETKSGSDSAPRAAHVPRDGLFRRVAWQILDAAYRTGYFVFSRQLIGSSRDTGWKIWADFARSCRADCVLPVVDIDSEFIAPRFLTTKTGRGADALFPKRYRFLPKRGTYVTPEEAATCGVPDLRPLGLEGFVWRRKAFAFHRRGHMRAPRNLLDAAAAENVWSEMLDSYASPTPASGSVGPS